MHSSSSAPILRRLNVEERHHRDLCGFGLEEKLETAGLLAAAGDEDAAPEEGLVLEPVEMGAQAHDIAHHDEGGGLNVLPVCFPGDAPQG